MGSSFRDGDGGSRGLSAQNKGLVENFLMVSGDGVLRGSRRSSKGFCVDGTCGSNFNSGGKIEKKKDSET